MKYTKGPWLPGKRTARYYCQADNGMDWSFEAISVGTASGQVAIIPLDESSITNAELICAAPEMYEALSHIRKELLRWSIERHHPEIIDKLNAAIFKAEGRIKNG